MPLRYGALVAECRLPAVIGAFGVSPLNENTFRGARQKPTAPVQVAVLYLHLGHDAVTPRASCSRTAICCSAPGLRRNYAA